jgi:hypothetical protein
VKAKSKVEETVTVEMTRAEAEGLRSDIHRAAGDPSPYPHLRALYSQLVNLPQERVGG